MRRLLAALLLITSPALAQENGWQEIQNGWGEIQTAPGAVSSACLATQVPFLGTPVSLGLVCDTGLTYDAAGDTLTVAGAVAAPFLSGYGAKVSAIDVPTGITAVLTGSAGSSSYNYAVVGKTADGRAGKISGYTSVTNAPSTLDGSNYITVGFTLPAGAACADIYRFFSPMTNGKIFSCVTTAQVDNGVAANGASAPTNQTGMLELTNGALRSCIYNDGTINHITNCATLVDTTWKAAAYYLGGGGDGTYNVNDNTYGGMRQITIKTPGPTTTLSTVATTTTASGFIPSTSEVTAILYRVTAGVTGCTSLTIQPSGGAAWVNIGTATTAQTTLTANATGILVPPSNLRWYSAGSAVDVTVACNNNATAGVLRITIVHDKYVAPTG